MRKAMDEADKWELLENCVSSVHKIISDATTYNLINLLDKTETEEQNEIYVR